MLVINKERKKELIVKKMKIDTGQLETEQ